MPLSRRSFLGLVGAGSAVGVSGGWVTARGLEAGLPTLAGSAGPIRLDSNENPMGVSPRSLDAIRAAFGEASRYPRQVGALVEDLARFHRVAPDRIMPACGSTEVLTTAVQAFTGPGRPLVTAEPSFETPATMAKAIGSPVRAVPVDRDLALDLGRMLDASLGAGLVFLCNPNNPTATVHGGSAIAEFVDQVRRRSPGTVILIDEAYHDYVRDPAYRTAIPLALSQPGVIVSRTFSKAGGLAGLRVGYALGDPDTLKPMDDRRLDLAISVPAIVAAQAVLTAPDDLVREGRRNGVVKDRFLKELGVMGLRTTRSETNFVMVEVKRDTRRFRAACREHEVMVGRPFPPFETWSRISIGTAEEMERATEVVRTVLSSNR